MKKIIVGLIAIFLVVSSHAQEMIQDNYEIAMSKNGIFYLSYNVELKEDGIYLTNWNNILKVQPLFIGYESIKVMEHKRIVGVFKTSIHLISNDTKYRFMDAKYRFVFWSRKKKDLFQVALVNYDSSLSEKIISK